MSREVKPAVPGFPLLTLELSQNTNDAKCDSLLSGWRKLCHLELMGVQTNKKRSFGRNLSDFGELKPAELELLRSAEIGQVCHIAKTKLQNASPDNTLRADFIRFLALGGDEQAPVHETGVWLVGGWIEDTLNLDFCKLPSPLRLQHCRLEQLIASGAEIPMLSLSATHIDAGVDADGIRVAGGVFLNAGFTANDTVSLQGANIGGNLECDGGHFNSTQGPNQNGVALACETAKIAGSVFLRVMTTHDNPSEPFTANGTVRLIGANIGGSLECDGSILDGQGRDAMDIESAIINGSVFLRSKFDKYSNSDLPFVATGSVRLVGVKIGGNFECGGGHFKGTIVNNKTGAAIYFDRASISGSALLSDRLMATGQVRFNGANVVGDVILRKSIFNGQDEHRNIGIALSFDDSIIEGRLFLDDNFSCIGILNLTGAKIGALMDAEACWPQPGQLVLDGLQIGRIGLRAPTNGITRVRWLKQQWPEHLTKEFKPQPWEETIRVLRTMGHPEDARIVAIAKQDQLRKSGRIKGLLKDLHWAWGLLAGYGYQPLKLASWMTGVWLLCGAAYLCAETFGRFAPTNPVIHANSQLAAACTSGPGSGKERWTTCKQMPDAYTTFSPFWYSADVLLPVVDLQQERDWAPAVTKNGERDGWGEAVRWLMWVEILFGWVTSLMLVAILTNLIKKD